MTTHDLQVHAELVPERVEAGAALPHRHLDEEVVDGEVRLEEVRLGDGDPLGARGHDARQAGAAAARILGWGRGLRRGHHRDSDSFNPTSAVIGLKAN